MKRNAVGTLVYYCGGNIVTQILVYAGEFVESPGVHTRFLNHCEMFQIHTGFTSKKFFPKGS